jgi:hypothetical protein
VIEFSGMCLPLPFVVFRTVISLRTRSAMSYVSVNGCRAFSVFVLFQSGQACRALCVQACPA